MAKRIFHFNKEKFPVFAEQNRVLRTRPPDFTQIRIAGREYFAFAPRIKAPVPG